MDFDDGVIKEGLERLSQISKQRSDMLKLLRQALIDDDYNGIKTYAKQLCGVNDEGD